MTSRAIPALAAAALLGAAAAGCGSGASEQAVARAGSTKVTQEQLEQTIELFRKEAQREGKAFSDGPAARKALVGLLVYRARLQEGAAALGITVSDEEVEQRLETSSAAEEREAGDRDAARFLESSVRAQLLTEAVYRRLSAGIDDPDPERRQAKRNAALRRWIASLPERYPTRR